MVCIKGIITLSPGFKIPEYFQSVNKTFLSYWFTTLSHAIITTRITNTKNQIAHMCILGNKIKELFNTLYIEIILYFARDSNKFYYNHAFCLLYSKSQTKTVFSSN